MGDKGLVPELRRCIFQLLLIFLLVMMTISYVEAVPVSRDIDPGEIELGQKIAAMVEERWERIAEPARTARLNMILGKLVPNLERDLPYEVRLIRENDPNAFSLPGGIIFITSGMYDFVKTDIQLAGVIAHELIHSDRQHGMIQASRNRKMSLVSLAVIIATRGQAAPALLANVAQTAISNSYSKDLECEADLKGMDLMLRSGYDPVGLLTVVEALAEEEIKHPWVDPGVYMDHPYIEERISYLLDGIREMGLEVRRKNALNLLNCTILRKEKRISLYIDQIEIWNGPEGTDMEQFMVNTKELLEKYLHLETPPYDIQIIHRPGNGAEALRVGPSIVLQEPLPPSATSLEKVRQKIIVALQTAQIKHPVTDFLR